MAREDVGRMQVNVTDASALAKAASGTNMVLCALPFYLNPAGREAAPMQARTISISPRTSRPRARSAASPRARRSRSCRNAAWRRASSRSSRTISPRLRQRCASVHMRVGALPEFPTNALKYNLTWSTDGLINEYCNPCEAIHRRSCARCCRSKGSSTSRSTASTMRRSTPPAASARLCETLDGSVENLNYKTVRYPGHRDLMQAAAVEDLRIERAARHAQGRSCETAVPIDHAGRGADLRHRHRHARGQPESGEFRKKIYAGRRSAKRSISAIQITTAAGICAMVDLFRNGKLPRRASSARSSRASGFPRQPLRPRLQIGDGRLGRAPRRIQVYRGSVKPELRKEIRLLGMGIRDAVEIYSIRE